MSYNLLVFLGIIVHKQIIQILFILAQIPLVWLEGEFAWVYFVSLIAGFLLVYPMVIK